MKSFNQKQDQRLKLLLSTAAVSTLIALTGCGKGFEAVPLASCETNCSNSNSGNPDAGAPQPTDQAWKTLSMDGGLVEGRFAKQQTVSLDKEKKLLLVRLPMPANPFLDGASVDFPIPELPGASLKLEGIAGGGSALVLAVPLDRVLRGVDFLPATRLPNGDPLPAIPDGELPSLGVQLTRIKDIKATIYLGPTIVGIYVNTPFDPFIRLTLPIVNQDRTRTWGYFTSIPAKSTADGGFFLSVAIPDDLARVIDDNL